jgi:hypothetical protein
MPMHQLPSVFFAGIDAGHAHGELTHLMATANLRLAPLDHDLVCEVGTHELADGIDRCRLAVAEVGSSTIELFDNCFPAAAEAAKWIAERYAFAS